MILTLTMNPSIDKSSKVDHVRPEDKLRCERPRREPGGGGLNVSRAVLRLGGTSHAFFTAGGPTGELLGDLLEREGGEREEGAGTGGEGGGEGDGEGRLFIRPLEVSGTTRENLFLREEGDQQFRFIFPGPELSEEEWGSCLDEVLDALRGEGGDDAPAWLVLSGSLPPGAPEDFYARLARDEVDREVRVVLDTSGAALEKGVEGGVDLLKPNVRELAQLAGRELESEEEQVEAARELLEAGHCRRAVVLSLGAGGVLRIDRDGERHFRTPTVPIRSKVGAGDSTVAGLVLALARGADLDDAVRHAVAAGAAAVMTPGTELCRREDAERLVDEVD